MSNPYLSVPIFSWPTAPGGLLYTYNAGGTVNAATYAEDGITPHTNPVVLDSEGKAIVRLDATTNYHFVLKDSTGANTLWDADHYDSLASVFLTANSVGSVLYKQTPIEATLSITPVNYQFPAGHVDRYFTNTTPGTTSATAAFQSAINQAKAGGADVVWGETGEYLLDGMLNATYPDLTNQVGITFRQIGHPSSDSPGGLLVKHNALAVFDLTGTDGAVFYDLTLQTDTSTYPKTCFFMARNTSGGNSQLNRFYNTKVAGRFSKAVLYNYGSEDGIYVGNYWANYATDAGAACVILTANNIKSLTSTFVPTMATGSQSTIDHQFLGGQYLCPNASTTTDVFYLDVVEELKVYGLWLQCAAAAANGRSYFYVDMTNGPSNFVGLHKVQGERGSFVPNYGLFFSNAAGTNTGWSLLDIYWQVGTASIGSGGSTPVIDNFRVFNLQEFANKGIIHTGSVTSSFIDYPGTITLNSFTGFIFGKQPNITITTNNGMVFDSTAAGGILTAGGLGLWGVGTPAAKQTGWGSPTNAAVVSNFSGSSATLAQCGNVLSEVIIMLKAVGLFGA